MLTVAFYLWEPIDGTEPIYSLGDVKLAVDMVDRHLTVPHEFVCITDNVAQFEGTGIRGVPLDRCTRGANFFEQLMPFYPDAGDLIGKRILAMDTDVVVVGNIDHIVSRNDDVVLWRNPARVPWHDPIGKGRHRALYNGSMMLVRAGSRPEIWQRAMSLPDVRRAMNVQDYLARTLGPDCAYWDQSHGVYRLERDDTPGSGIVNDLPENARIVYFVGSEHKPWRKDVQARCPWIAAHRR